MDSPLPTYEELPLNETLNMRHAWGVFGEDDELGTVNLLTSERVAAAREEIRTGKMFNVCLPLDLPNPQFSGRQPFEHTVFSIDRNTQDDRLDNFHLQASTQWDSLRHVRAREFGFYNGISGEDAGPEGDKLGIERWVNHGIVGRGVLLDVARYCESRGTPLNPRSNEPIGPDLLEEVAAAQRSPLRVGDILMLRTGFIKTYLAASDAERETFPDGSCPGLTGSEDMARYLWNKHVAAVIGDNNALELIPVDPAIGFLHRRIIPLLGLAVGEFFDFESLAEDCASDGRYTTFFVSVPLNLRGAVGSPGNAIVIK